MPVYIKERWMLFLVLMVFTALKLPHLSYPFFWDESWVYAPAVKEMYRNGPSLLPSVIAVDFSRGHPLFFHFLMACWMKVFGASNTAMHTFPLLISLALLIAIYEITFRLFDRKTAIAALLLVSCQVIFFVQSSFVLLEIQLAFMGVLSIWFYCRKRYLLTILCLSAAFYTKESGMVLGVVLGIDAFLNLFKKKETTRQKVLGIISVFVPFLLIGLFFVLQHYQRGWFMYPYHTGLIDLSWPHVYDKVRSVAKFLFRDDYRKYLYVFIGLLSLVAALLKKDIKLAVPLLSGIFIFLVASDQYHAVLPYFILLLMFVGSIFYTLYVLRNSNDVVNSDTQHFLVLAAAFVICFIAFSAINLFIARYLIIALVFMLMITAVIFTRLTSVRKWMYIPGIAVVLSIQAFSFYKCHDLTDVNLGAFDAMYVQQRSISFFEDHNLYEKNIAINQYLQWVHLLDENTGFKKDAKPFKYVSWGKGYGTEYLLFDNIESNIDTAKAYLEVKADSNFIQVYKVSRGMARAEIYGLRKHP